jgi:hypothetical protein
MEIDWSEAPEWADRAVEWKGVVFYSDGNQYTGPSTDGIHLHGGLVGRDSDVRYFDYSSGNLIETRPDAWQEGEERMKVIPQNGNNGEHYGEVVKQERYKKENGMDKIDEWARDKTHDQFRTIMWAMCEKYESRLGKKDDIVKEVGKMADYMNRWHLYEQKWAEE